MASFSLPLFFPSKLLLKADKVGFLSWKLAFRAFSEQLDQVSQQIQTLVDLEKRIDYIHTYTHVLWKATSNIKQSLHLVLFEVKRFEVYAVFQTYLHCTLFWHTFWKLNWIPWSRLVILIFDSFTSFHISVSGPSTSFLARLRSAVACLYARCLNWVGQVTTVSDSHTHDLVNVHTWQKCSFTEKIFFSRKKIFVQVQNKLKSLWTILAHLYLFLLK